MADFNALEALINANIKKNGVQAITGNILNGILRGMVSALGKGYTIAGSVTPSSDPGTMTGPVAYIAYTAGTYTHFDGLEVEQGEVAMLIYNEAEWHKEVLFSLAANATVDGNVGTPEVGVSFVDGLLTFDFRNMKGEPGENGQDGEAAGFGAVTASVDASVGTPSVTVSSSGPNTAKSFAFSFHNLKGEQGVQGIQGIQGPQGVQGEQGIQGPVGVESCVVTVDNTSGTPSCSVSLVGQVLHLDFTGLKGAQGDTGSSVDYPFTIVNNLTTNDATQALSAAMGVQLKSEVSQLEAKVDDLSTGKYYGYFSKEEDLPEANVDGFAYVGEGPTYTIYNLRGGVWTSSDITVNQSPIGNDEDIDQNEDGKLQFANRTYNSQQPNGMGYKILRKDATFASQVADTNTIYEIRYPFAVGIITMPSGCILLFNGGELTSGTLTGNGTRISGDAKIACGFAGTFDVDKTKLSWFGTDKAAFEKAMDFCAITTGKTLDGENIVCSITGTVTFLERHNINLERLNIRYTPTANGESLFVFDCETQYGAGNNYMKECYFESTTTSFSSVHCLNFKRWFNTTKATFDRVTAKYFTGYVIVNQSYLQEAVFDTVKGSKVGGYISFNPDLNYGENKGSSNLLYFLNCGIDEDIIGADIPYVIDLCNMMTANFVNFVAQGSNYLAPNTKAIRLDEPNNLIGDVVLDTAWFEFYGADANYNKVDIGQAVNLTMKHRCPLHIKVTGIGVYIKINTETQRDFDYVLDNLSITNPERTHIDFDYGGNTAELTSTLIAKVRALYDTGVCGKFSYHSQVNRSPLVVFENKLALNEDGISRYVEHSLIRTNVSTFGMKVVSVNGVNVLSFTAGDTSQNVILPYPYFLPTHKIVYVDIIFRIFTEIAVTSSNISTIVCKSAMFGPNNFKQGSQISPYTPVDGQAAGYTDGWKRISYVVHATDAASALKTFYLTMRNTRIEFAKISYKTMFSIDEEEVFLDNGNLVRRNSGADHFRLLGLDAYSRKVLFTEGIYNAIKDSDATYEIDGKTFKASNGGVDLVASSYRHSGTTAQRPNFGTDAWYKSFFAGWLYLDETLNKSIIWSGTDWVNMDGTALS